MFENSPFSFQSGVTGPPINSGETTSVFTVGSSPVLWKFLERNVVELAMRVK